VPDYDPTQEPDRLTLGKLDTGDMLEVQYNPEQLKEALKPIYAKLQILGMSHEPLQYGYTENFSVSFDLKFDAVTRYRNGTYDVNAARRFLLGAGYARRSGSAKLLSNGQPTSVVVIWPKLYTLTCKMMAYAGDLTTFASDGSLLRFTAHLQFEEARDMRLWAEDVESQGTVRPVNAPVDPYDTTANGG
jgi:hypothetical protein